MMGLRILCSQLNRLLGSPRQLGTLLFALLTFGELLVFLRYSATTGAVLLICTVGLVFAVRQLARESARTATENVLNQRREAEEGFLLDSETGLPNRQHLIDQLAREIARAQRYSHEMTITLVEVSRFGELQSAWGAETARNAVRHVADTLRRITRTSDFLARIDETHFALVLMQCDWGQAQGFGDRIALAVSNRPLRSSTPVKVPLYVTVDVRALQYEATKFRGPLDFLSAAGGDMTPVPEPRRRPGSGGGPGDPRALRRALVKDYYPEGQMSDFADAYREHRGRRAI